MVIAEYDKECNCEFCQEERKNQGVKMRPATTDELKLFKILQMLGFDSIDMTSNDNRIIYQKIIYLLQNYGVSLGYGYKWYIRGPFSSELQHDLIEVHYLIHGKYPDIH